MSNESRLKYLRSLSKIKIEDAIKFLGKSKPENIDFLCHVIKTFKHHSPPEIKRHLTKILRSKTARIAKKRMIAAHNETGGAFSDWLKKAGNSVTDMAKRAGSSITSTASSFFDKALPMAQKGLEFAKPYIKEYGPTLAGKAAAMIPVIGPIAEPIAKKGAEWLLGKLF
jgi:hypothetical protein